MGQKLNWEWKLEKLEIENNVMLVELCDLVVYYGRLERTTHTFFFHQMQKARAVPNPCNVLMSVCMSVTVTSTLGLLLHPAIDVDPGLLCVLFEVHRLQLSLVVFSSFC